MIGSRTWLAAIAAVNLMFQGEAAVPPRDFIACLEHIKKHADTTLSTASSPDYATSRLGFNYLFDFKPAAIYRPATEADAAAAVKCAADNGVPIAPRSGGHSFEGYSGGGRDGVLIVDLALLTKFSVDKATGVATIGAGWRLGPLYAQLWDTGPYLIAAGTCPSVGIGGHTLGGGLGNVGRKYGMASDNVVGMNMIDAKGKVLKVNKSTNPDLFWALRGAGGGSFGLVTEFRMQAYDAPDFVTTGSLGWPLSNYSIVLDAYAKWGKTAPDEVMTEMNVSPSGCDIQLTYLGNSTAANATVNELVKLIGKPKYRSLKEGNWYEAATRWAWLNGGTLADPVLGDAHHARGRSLVYRKPLSIKEKDIMFKYMSNPPKGGSSVYAIVDIWGGKINRPNSPSSFDSHRGVQFGIEFISEWGDSESQPGLTCPDCLDWSAKFAKEMQAAYSSGPLEAYQNYIERDMPNSLTAYYGNSLDRLKSIKKKYDPFNAFNFAQSIPL